jgi:glycerol-3-phosphate cytidylyltransferase
MAARMHRGSPRGVSRRDFAALGVEVIYFPYSQATSSSALRRTLQNIDVMANRAFAAGPTLQLAHAA